MVSKYNWKWYQWAYLIFFAVLFFIGVIVFFLDLKDFVHTNFNNEKKAKGAKVTFTVSWAVVSIIVYVYFILGDKKSIFYFLLFYSLISWVVFYRKSILFLKKQKITESIDMFNVKILKSIIFASSAWTSISTVIWTFDLNKGLLSNIMAISQLTVGLITLYFPVIDMYTYIKEAFRKEQDRIKEKMKYDYYNYD